MLHNDRHRECPTGPHRPTHSPRTGSSAFGGELPARPDLRERSSGTLRPTGVTGEPFYTAFCWSSAWHSRGTSGISNFSIQTLSKIDPQSEQLDGVDSLRSIRSRNNWTVSSNYSQIDPQSEQLDGVDSLRSIRSRNNWTVSSYLSVCIFHSGTGINADGSIPTNNVKIPNGQWRGRLGVDNASEQAAHLFACRDDSRASE